MSSVSFRRLEKNYGSLRIVKGIDLEIADREFVVLVGPSGCGKSTTLRMLAGLESISGGEIRIGEKVVNRLPPRERDIAMVFQDYALYPHKTVYENMAFSLKVRGVAEAETRTATAQGGGGRGAGAPGRPRPAPAWPRRPPGGLPGSFLSASRASFRAASASALPWAAPSC